MPRIASGVVEKIDWGRLPPRRAEGADVVAGEFPAPPERSGVWGAENGLGLLRLPPEPPDGAVGALVAGAEGFAPAGEDGTWTIEAGRGAVGRETTLGRLPLTGMTLFAVGAAGAEGVAFSVSLSATLFTGAEGVGEATAGRVTTLGRGGRTTIVGRTLAGRTTGRGVAAGRDGTLFSLVFSSFLSGSRIACRDTTFNTLGLTGRVGTVILYSLSPFKGFTRQSLCIIVNSIDYNISKEKWDMTQNADEMQPLQTISPELEAQYKESLKEQEVLNERARRGEYDVEQIGKQIEAAEAESVRSFQTPIADLPDMVNRLVPTTEKEMIAHIQAVKEAAELQRKLDAEYAALKAE